MTAAFGDTELWVFGYGSLIWRPGFAFEDSHPARLYGYHRSLCIFSHVHRGTPERPGLVLGLDRGGICRGLAFRVAADRAQETVDNLRRARTGDRGLSGAPHAGAAGGWAQCDGAGLCR